MSKCHHRQVACILALWKIYATQNKKKVNKQKQISHFEFEIDNLWGINQDYCYEF